jgi:hypothetical protein
MALYGYGGRPPGVIAVGDTVEECREDPIRVIEGWIAHRLIMGDTIPGIDGVNIEVSTKRWLLSRLLPVIRNELIRRLGKLGFDGPYPESGHAYMAEELAEERVYVTIPNHIMEKILM